MQHNEMVVLPLPQERENRPLPLKNPKPFDRQGASNAETDSRKSKAAHRAPSPGGDGRGEGERCIGSPTVSRYSRGPKWVRGEILDTPSVPFLECRAHGPRHQRRPLPDRRAQTWR